MIEPAISTRRRWLSTEVVQTSGTDCGPAALKCILEGYGVAASYSRLREACRTNVDGTSLNAIEDVAAQLGLRADQMVLPVDHLFASEAGSPPGIVVTRLPDGSTHFVVIWRQVGGWVQIMDPATGRRWLRTRRLLDELYIHSMPVSAAAWREWAESEAPMAVLRRRMSELGVPHNELLSRALTDKGWRGLASLDAAVRMARALLHAGALKPGREATRAVERFCENDESIPDNYWSVRPCAGSTDQITLTGAVLIKVYGLVKRAAVPASDELKAVLTEKPIRPGFELLRLLRADGLLVPAVLMTALMLAAGAVIAEAVLLRGFLELSRELGLTGQRLAAVLALCAFFAFLLLLEFPLTSSLFHYGRRLEIRLRQAFFEKLPRLADRYFQSRLKSDMADRSHTIHNVRHLPELGSQLLRGVFQIVLTVAGIAWVDPPSAPLAVAAAVIAVGFPLAVQPLITERDLREKTLGGVLSGFYLDALLGLIPIRAHRAERAIRRGHNQVLEDWARAGLSLQRATVAIETLQLFLGYGLAAWLLFDHLTRRGEAGTVLLLAYWALNLPVIGDQIASVAWQYPALRNATLRLVEPLGAPEESTAGARAHSAGQQTIAPDPPQDRGRVFTGPGIIFQNVSVVAAGHRILEGISLDLQPGSHVAIVGPSGAGKSTMAGLLLGWHHPAHGKILVDGVPLDGHVQALRRETAWVDPSVQLWNRSLYENLRYGTDEASAIPISEAIETADLRQVVEKLPDGFESSLGDGGTLVSGGEGQRVRFARSMMRQRVRLVILDEAFRGLDREQRRSLLKQARQLWREATLICITHDFTATLGFDRVLVVEAGRIVEDGNPDSLARKADSRYRALLDAEEAAAQSLWSGNSWQRLRLEDGQVRPARKDLLS